MVAQTICHLYAVASSCRSLARAKPHFSKESEWFVLDVLYGPCTRGTEQIRTVIYLLI